MIAFNNSAVGRSHCELSLVVTVGMGIGEIVSFSRERGEHKIVNCYVSGN